MSTTDSPPAVTIDPAQARMIQELKHDRALFGCRIDPTGQYVFAGALDNTLIRWHLATGTKVAHLGHTSWLRGIAFAAHEKQVFSADYSGRILTWPIEADAPQVLRTIQAHTGWCRALAVSPDGKLLASCGNDGLVKLWSVADGTPVAAFAGHASHVYNVAFHPTLPLLASADQKGTIKVWDLAQGQSVKDLDAKLLYRYDTLFSVGVGGARAMAFSLDGALLACTGITDLSNANNGVGNPALLLIDWATGQQRPLLKLREAFNGTGWGVAFHPAGFVVSVAGGETGILSFWKPDVATDTFTLKLPVHARDLSLHPNGRHLAIPFSDGTLRIYDIGPNT